MDPTDLRRGVLAALMTAVGASAFTADANATVQDDEFLGFEDELESLEEDESSDDNVEFVELDAATFAETIAGLFAPAEAGVLIERQFDPEPRRVLRAGPVDFVARWEEALVFDDNVFLTENGEEDDIILRSTIGLIADVEFGGGDHRFVIGYDHERNWFTGGEARSFVEHFVTGRLELDFNQLKVTLGDRWEDRTDPILAVFTGKIERTLNTAFANVRWEEPDYYLSADVVNTTHDFQARGFGGFDRDDRTALLEYGGPLNDHTENFFQFGYVGRDFDRGALNDMKGFVVAAGVRYTHSDELQLLGRVGVRRESYDDDAGTDSDDDDTEPEIEGRISYAISAQGVLEGSYLHSLEFSPIGNNEAFDRLESVYAHRFNNRLRGQVGLGVELVNPSAGKSFQRYSAGLGIHYALATYAHVSLEYLARCRRNGFDNSEFDSNVFVAGVEARF